MPYTIQQLDDLPVPAVLTRITSPLDAHGDLRKMLAELDAALGTIEGGLVYNIVDASQFSTNFAELVAGLAVAIDPHSENQTPHLFDSRLRAVMIGSGALLKLVVKSMSQDQYGNRTMELYETLDDALAHIKQARAA